MTRRAASFAVPAFPAVDEAGNYSPALAALRGRDASGIYAIIDAATLQTLYIGESHTGRLYDTITRHFRRWKINAWRDATGRSSGGTTYDRSRVLIAYTVLPAAEVMDAQAIAIAEADPRDNTHRLWEQAAEAERRPAPPIVQPDDFAAPDDWPTF